MSEVIQGVPTFPIEFLMELGEPVPEPGMSISEAIYFHCEALAKDGGQVPAADSDVSPTISDVQLAEVEVSGHQTNDGV